MECRKNITYSSLPTLPSRVAILCLLDGRASSPSLCAADATGDLFLARLVGKGAHPAEIWQWSPAYPHRITRRDDLRLVFLLADRGVMATKTRAARCPWPAWEPTHSRAIITDNGESC